MKYSHTIIGWIITSVGLTLVISSFVVAQGRGFTAWRFFIDSFCVLLCGLAGSVAILGLLSLFRSGGGMGDLILLPTIIALGTAPFLLLGLYLGERIQSLSAPSFFTGTAILALLGATLVSFGFAALIFRLINGPDGGSTGGWELGFIPLFAPSPILWICLLVGFYSLAYSKAHRTACLINPS